jgi:signal transduction histidine kinase
MAGLDLVGRSCEELCSECEVSSAHTQDNIETILASNLFGKQGQFYQVTTAPIKGVNGDTSGYIRLIQDVTEIKKMEEQMSNSEKLASIGRLAAGIAHEIGNPLASVFSFVQILREMEEDEFKKDSLQTIYFHVNRISETLKQLSGYSKMPLAESGQCQVNDIIETSVNLIQYDKRAKEISINRELSDTLPQACVDANQLSQVFVNLILNALDAMPDGGYLTVRSYEKDSSVIIEFKDTGIGIPKENLMKIFDPFYTTKEKGTGLGLAVSYNIVKKMDGILSVESELGKGTTFTIKIPGCQR